jgi:HEXXH motif-containing protein
VLVYLSGFTRSRPSARVRAGFGRAVLADIARIAAEVVEDRIRRVARINELGGLVLPGAQLLPPQLAETSAGYALAFHAIYGVEHFNRDPAAEREALQARFCCQDPGTLVVSSADCLNRQDPMFDDIVYLPPADSLSRARQTEWATSLDLLAECVPELAVVTELGAGVIVQIGGSVGARRVTRSYSLTPFPATVFLEKSEDPLVNADNLLHECGHGFLNQALAATGGMRPSERTWYSPWKRTNRPGFAIVHSALSFSIVTLLRERALDLLRPNSVQLARAITSERLRLLSLATEAIDAVDLIENRELRRTVLSIWELALGTQMGPSAGALFATYWEKSYDRCST